jgi:membrane-associated phospholipid phosphatase
MRTSGLRNARDYNRGLAPPVRGLHAVWALIAPIVGPVAAWIWHPLRRMWALPLLVTAAMFPLVHRLDPSITAWATSIRLGGDARREFEALQQYGQGVSIVVVGLVIWLQDPARRRRLADWGAALAVAFLFVQIGKLLVGRPRPKYGDPFVFLGPLGQYPVLRTVNGEPVGIRHAWELWGGISSDLASMPSSHTVYAVIMAVVLGTLYPRLRAIVWVLAVVVGAGRVMTNAHYATDVLVGAGLGMAVGWTAMRFCWGQRVLERLGWGRAATERDASRRVVAASGAESGELLPASRERD